MFSTAQMIEWHEMGCFVTNPLIRRVEEKVESATPSDFDAAFEEEDNAKSADSAHPWIPADKIDYFENYSRLFKTSKRINKLSGASPPSPP